MARKAAEAEKVELSAVTEAEAASIPPGAVEGAPIGDDGIPVLQPDGVIPPDDYTPDQKSGVDVGAVDADTGFADSAPVLEGDVTVIVATPISGLRNGQPWPAVGDPITLPAAEAASYIQFGYVRAAD